jgi:hypothetical protein
LVKVDKNSTDIQDFNKKELQDSTEKELVNNDIGIPQLTIEDEPKESEKVNKRGSLMGNFTKTLSNVRDFANKRLSKDPNTNIIDLNNPTKRVDIRVSVPDTNSQVIDNNEKEVHSEVVATKIFEIDCCSKPFVPNLLVTHSKQITAYAYSANLIM